MQNKTFSKTEQPLEAHIINLQKQALDKLNRKTLPLMEKARSLITDPKVPIRLRVYTVINLCTLYVKSRQELAGLKILTDELGVLNAFKEYIWEKAIILSGISNIKSLMGSYEEALHDLLTCIELLKVIKEKDRNYYTLLVTVYYNCYVEAKNTNNNEDSLKYLSLAKQTALRRLGMGSGLFKFLSSFQEPSPEDYIKNLQQLHPISPSNRVSPVQHRAKSTIETNFTKKKHRIFKKFEKASASTPSPTGKSRAKLKNHYRSPLTALIEEDEEAHSVISRQSYEKNPLENHIIDTSKSHNPKTHTKSTHSYYSCSSSVDDKPKNLKPKQEIHQKDLKKIVKIQSFFRGILVRKKYTLMRKRRQISYISIKTQPMKTLQSRVREAMSYNESISRAYPSKKFIKKSV
ncbi:hypothetical protein SteCoe_5146 [Stentor coeruleus]|uniref:Uncharacterized protein n=1 Tax=Stentor coeruleus TaxID=5963 RepID=A0A1R2CT05_9CILI|nr:hypothetical protein SteCoe_5146 [Stentor coeruleus]